MDVEMIGTAADGDMVPSKALLLYGRYDAWDGLLDLRPGSASKVQLQRFLNA